jgi:hypothetical protein
MNWIMILGVIFIAIGTGLTMYGSSIESKRSAVISQKAVNEKIDDAMSEIKEIKEGALPEGKKEEVKKVEDEFSAWASEFIENIDKQKVEYAKSELNRDSLALSVNKQWKPKYEYLINTTKQLIIAYNTTTDNKIIYEIPPLPKSIFSKDSNSYEATISFSESIEIKFSLSLIRYVSEDIIPSISFFILDKEYFKSDYHKHSFVLLFFPKRNNITLGHISSDVIPPIADFPVESDLIKYEEWVKDLLTTMLEYYIIRLS